MSVIPLLAASGTIFLDARAHKTIYDGCQVARARGAAVKRFRFEDPDHLDELLSRRARPDAPRLHGRRQQHDRQRAGPRARSPRRAASTARCSTSTTRTASASSASAAGRPTCPTATAATASSATPARPTRTSSWSAASRRPTRRCWPSSPARPSVKDLLKVAAPPYLYSGPSPVASLATVLAGFDVNEQPRRRAARATCTAMTARVLDALDRLGVATPNRSGFPIIEIPLRDHHAHRGGRPVPLRPRRLRDARRVPARPQERGRLPRPAHRGQHRRRGRRGRSPASRSSPSAASCSRRRRGPASEQAA